jgi:hypothetical protein
MSEFLTREDIIGLVDIDVKEITIPDTVHAKAWQGKKLFIKQLTRGQQDQYLKRQFGDTRMKQDARAQQQEISAVNIYGHDAWICVRGIVTDESGTKLMFTDSDLAKLNEKSGSAIGWIASEIIEFSDMKQDVAVARGDITPEQALENDIKNS